jgi:DNA-binding transcriptional regulator LsrR (DeoR family)
MALIKRLVTKARRGNAVKIYINKAAFLASLLKAAYYVQLINISSTPATYNLYSARGRPFSL